MIIGPPPKFHGTWDLDVPLDQRRRVDDRDLPRSQRNVKRWRDGQMALRWCAAGMVEAGKQFRRVNGHMHLRSPARHAGTRHPTGRCHRSY